MKKVIKVKKIDAEEYEVAFKVASSIINEQLKVLSLVNKNLKEAEMTAKGVDEKFMSKMKEKQKIMKQVESLLRQVKGA